MRPIAPPPPQKAASSDENGDEARSSRAEARWSCTMPAVKPVPDGYPSLTPYLIVADAAAAIAFYQQVFGATLRMKLDGPDGKIGHAELEIGNSLIMLADEHPEMGALSPKAGGGTPAGLHLSLEHVHDVATKAVAVGAPLKRPVDNP